MENSKITALIMNWLKEFHDPNMHADILEKVLVVGKDSHRWVETIQRYIEGKTMQRPTKGEIKMACRAILNGMGKEEGIGGKFSRRELLDG